MRHHLPAVAFFACVLVNGMTFARGKPLENIPLKWTPTSNLAEMGPLVVSGTLLTTKIHIDAIADTRQNPSLIAENREKANKIRPVTTSSDVAAFVTDHLKESLHGAGLNVVDSGADVSISGEVRQFFVTELNTYSGRICGNNKTSRIEGEFVYNMTRRSTPNPSPAAGGMPYSNART
jgi:hypothetical protein